ncbi:hypothetical protein [Paenibacillus sp. GCM10012306]|uniref:hypothetical protein n=1 Tax=Paenibacillus sp. GCM10012306 TaxID=3317342 RepID=UPI0036D2121E
MPKFAPVFCKHLGANRGSNTMITAATIEGFKIGAILHLNLQNYPMSQGIRALLHLIFREYAISAAKGRI